MRFIRHLPAILFIFLLYWGTAWLEYTLDLKIGDQDGQIRGFWFFRFIALVSAIIWYITTFYSGKTRKNLMAGFVLLVILEMLSGYFLFDQNFQANGFAITQIFNSHKSTAFAERSIRLREWPPNLNRLEKPSKAYLEMTDNLEQKPFLIRTDPNGFIEPSRIYEKPDLTLVFQGGSTTECLFVDENKRFPYLAGKILSDSSQLKVNSYNAGCSGNHSMHSLNILLNKIISLDPDYVMWMHNINDLITLAYEGNYWDVITGRSLISGGKSNSTYEQDEWAEMRGNIVEIDSLEMQRQFRSSIRDFIQTCRIWGIEPVLLTQASRIKDSPDEKGNRKIFKKLESVGWAYPDFKRAYDNFNEIIRSEAKTHAVLLIDLAGYIPQNSDYMYDSVHFNDRGSELAARLIAFKLMEVEKEK